MKIKGIILISALMIISLAGMSNYAVAMENNSAPKIENINVIDITDTSAKVEFEINQSDADTIIRYGTTRTLNKRSDWNNETDLLRAIELLNLDKNKTYYYSIYAYNGTDQRYFTNSTIRSFKTLDLKKPIISNIITENIKESSADISFNVDQEDAKTRIYYGTTINLDERSNWNNETELSRTISLSDLLSGTKYFYSIYAFNGTNLSYYSNSTIRNFTTKTAKIGPKIIEKTPDNKYVESIEKEYVNFSAKFDQIVNVTWLLNDTDKKTEDLVKYSYYNATSSIGTWNVTVVGENKNGSASFSWIWTAHPKTYLTGNRIWDESKGMNRTYKWNSYSFAGFYYDLDDDLATEELVIRNIRRNIDKGYITYTTSPIEVDFDYSKFGKYQVIGFMADKYFAGYTKNSSVSDNKVISAIGSGQLHNVLLDDDSKKTIVVGGSLTLMENYTFRAKEIDLSSRQVWFVLYKDGDEVDSDVIEAGNTYTYEKKVGSIDIPIIAIHIDSVFRGREINAAFIKGIFQISEKYDSAKSGNRYDRMEIIGYSKDKITMENRDSVDLSAGNTVDLMGNLKIIVADSDVLRFALSVERKGEFEARGTVNPIVDEWTPMNFGLNVGNTNVGFYYDLDEDIGTEKLKIEDIKGRSIKEGKLIYSTSPQEVSFEYSNFGKYEVIGFMADKYFAGYTKNSLVSSKKEISVLDSDQLHKIILDDDDKRTFYAGSTISLKEGYALRMTDIDIGAGTGTIWIVLYKDGKEVDNDVVAGGENYIYEKKVGGKEIPVIAIHFDSVFRGREVNAAFIKGIFQISESYTEIRSGKSYGKMEITEVSRNKIVMENDDDIDLSSGSTIDIMGNIKFKVADSDELRFYPFVLVTPEMIENKLQIDSPNKANAGETIKINITAGGNPIEGVSISIEPLEQQASVGLLENKTDSKGSLSYIIPITLKGTYTIKASKIGYTETNKTIEIEQRKLSIEAPATANQLEDINIKVSHNDTPIRDAVIILDNTTIGFTNDKGILSYTLPEIISGIRTITASKTGYINASRYIDVKILFSEFKAIDINITPNKISENEKIFVKSNITNIGNKKDTKPVELKINDTVVSNISINLAPNETKEINFTHKVNLSKGNYTVEILGQKGLIEVKEGLNLLLIGGILSVIAIVTVVFLKRKKSKGD